MASPNLVYALVKGSQLRVCDNLNKFSASFSLTPIDNRRLATLCGQCDEHLRQIETQLNVQITNRGNEFTVIGEREANITAASSVLTTLYREAEHHTDLTPNAVHLVLQQSKVPNSPPSEVIFRSKKGPIKPRTQSQVQFVKNIVDHAINFGIGPAGTGKTYLAVACAVQALETEQISRILLVRPVVEAGETLGFLPGDYVQKLDPYLRPLYDALNDMLGNDKVNKLLERGTIEIAPLAYMRGRTLNDSFILLDESQNCTKEQMKMFLTRIGFGSTVVITGDVTQVDLPRHKFSGLKHAELVLKDIKGISFTYFDHNDVMRHPLVEQVVQAYNRFEIEQREEQRKANEEKKGREA